MAVASVAAVLATALLLGGMVFFAVAVAPLVFARLPAGQSGPFIRQVFPVYYLYVGGTAAAAAVALLAVRPADAAAMAAVAGATWWLRQVLMARINADSDLAQATGDPAAKARFDRGHRLSVAVNLAQMAVAAVVLARFAV